MKKLIFTQDQEQALEEVTTWLKDPDSQVKTLKGYAGTGKTTLLDEIVKRAKALELSVKITATTNKAVRVLRERIKTDKNSFSTIHSVLGVKAVQVEGIEIFEPDSYEVSSITSYNLIIIDECSMISSIDLDERRLSLLTTILKQIEGRNTKVLFCGDQAQLQPIGEQVSKCFAFEPSELKEIVRHDDGIAQSALLVRDTSRPVVKQELINEPHVIALNKDSIHTNFLDWHKNPDSIRMLCWTNKAVDFWNRKLRKASWSKDVLPDFLVGDIVIANTPCFERLPHNNEERIIMANSDEGVIQAITEHESHYLLKVLKFSDETVVELRVLRDSYKPYYEKELKELARIKDWRNFWDLKKRYHDIKFCYAMTVHKSQGSTFDKVVLDTGDIYFNREILNRNQLLYVGITRAAKQVILI